MFPCLPYLAYITLDLNPASWAALVAQLAEHWTSNPVVTGSNPVRGSSVFFSLSAFGLCLTLSCLPLHIHVQDLIMYIIGTAIRYLQWSRSLGQKRASERTQWSLAVSGGEAQRTG